MQPPFLTGLPGSPDLSGQDMWDRIDSAEEGHEEIVHNIDMDEDAATWQVRGPTSFSFL